MKITIMLEGTDFYRELEVLPSMRILDVKFNVQKEFNIPYDQMEFLLNNQPLPNDKSISQIGIGNNNFIILRKINPNILLGQSYGGMPQGFINSNSNIILPYNLDSTNNNIINTSHSNLGNSLYNQNSIEEQRKIEEMIRRQNLNRNLKHAAEFMPESLVPVHMLYINVEINNFKVSALVDTGAQSSFMSLNFCKKYNLMNMLDTRFSGIARGVGASRIVGVIHAINMKIMNKIIPIKINVIENNDVGFVLGLDNLRKYNCNIDLKKNGLVFPDIGIVVKFLSDGEIKKMKEERELQEEKEEIERAKLESLNYI